ncbi:MAG: DUF2213 domain-containing protein [Deltaproteobacteria bacterium]|nr:DUF2213 domain-containing protein [Deltaproteobacteria bacterium]
MGKATKTSAGFLRVPATFGAEGILKYTTPEGGVIRELRTKKELFKTDSIATLRGALLTVDHPSVMGRKVLVGPSNAKEFGVGFIADESGGNKTRLDGFVTVTDPNTIAQIDAGSLVEISPGYTCRVDATPGVHETFGPYDQIQTDIIYNHVALGPKDWNRAGSEVALRLDSNGSEVIPEIRADKGQGEKMKIKIDGITFDVEANVAEAIEQNKVRADSALSVIEAERDTLKGRVDAMTPQLEKAKKDLAEATDETRIDSKVAARIKLVESAKAALPKDTKIEGASLEIMSQVIRNDSKDADLADKSEGYIQGRFDAICDGATQKTDASLAASQAAAAAAGGTRLDSEDARAKMIKRNAEAWETKPAA